MSPHLSKARLQPFVAFGPAKGAVAGLTLMVTGSQGKAMPIRGTFSTNKALKGQMPSVGAALAVLATVS